MGHQELFVWPLVARRCAANARGDCYEGLGWAYLFKRSPERVPTSMAGNDREKGSLSKKWEINAMPSSPGAVSGQVVWGSCRERLLKNHPVSGEQDSLEDARRGKQVRHPLQHELPLIFTHFSLKWREVSTSSAQCQAELQRPQITLLPYFGPQHPFLLQFICDLARAIGLAGL